MEVDMLSAEYNPFYCGDLMFPDTFTHGMN